MVRPEYAWQTTSLEAGRRLDRVLADRFPDIPRSRFKDWIEAGKVVVDDLPRRPGYRLRGDEEVRLDLPPPEAVDIPGEPIPVGVLFEDEHLLVVDKQAGLTVHPSAHQPTGTLVNALIHRGTALSNYHEDRFRPGIVHRLDRGTSGVLVVAKTRRAHADLAGQFECRTVDKEYRAIARGSPEHEEGEIDLPIGKDRRVQGRMAVRQDAGREALTRYRVLERLRGFSYLAVYLGTGRTHQIRVHLGAIGHPLLCDPLYGGGPAETFASTLAGESRGEDEPPVLARPALHAFRLSLDHPVSGERLIFTAPLHEDFRNALDALKVSIR